MAVMHQSGSNLADRPKDQGAGNKDKGILDKAKDAGNAALNKAGEAASWVGEKAGDATAAVGSGMKSLGETIRDKGPQSGILGSAAGAVGSGLESTGNYLEEKGISGMCSDVTGLMKRYPIATVLIGVGLGFMISRLMSSRS